MALQGARGVDAGLLAPFAQISARDGIVDRHARHRLGPRIIDARLAHAIAAVIFLEMFPDARHAEPVRRLRLDRRAKAPERPAVDVVAGIDIVHDALAVEIEARHAHPEFLAGRQVHETLEPDHVVIAIFAGHARAVFAQLRLVGEDVDDAAGGVAAIERALRPAQHLDSLHIVEFRVGDAGAIDRRIIFGDADALIASRRDQGIADTANLKIARSVKLLAIVEVGHLQRQIGGAVEAAGFQRLLREGRDRDRDILQGFGTALRGDDDVGCASGRRRYALRRWSRLLRCCDATRRETG